MNWTLSDHVIEASHTDEFHYRYRRYAPGISARALVVYLPQYGGTLDAWEDSLWIEEKASCLPSGQTASQGDDQLL